MRYRWTRKKEQREKGKIENKNSVEIDFLRWTFRVNTRPVCSAGTLLTRHRHARNWMGPETPSAIEFVRVSINAFGHDSHRHGNHSALRMRFKCIPRRCSFAVEQPAVLRVHPRRAPFNVSRFRPAEQRRNNDGTMAEQRWNNDGIGGETGGERRGMIRNYAAMFSRNFIVRLRWHRPREMADVNQRITCYATLNAPLLLATEPEGFIWIVSLDDRCRSYASRNFSSALRPVS